MKVVLADGTVVEGTDASVKTILEKIGLTPGSGDSVIYVSKSQGPLLIKDMNTLHLRNAMLKLYEKWLANLRDLNGPELLKALEEGPSEDVMIAMIGEFAQRPDMAQIKKPTTTKAGK